MLYPYITLSDDTEIVYQKMHRDKRVLVRIETPDEKDGFHSGACYLPDYTWDEINGYSAADLQFFEDLLGRHEDEIMLLANEAAIEPRIDLPSVVGRRTRRWRAKLKQTRRMLMLKDLGEQGGTIYERHIVKIHHSSGYMRTGNVSHYVQIGAKRKTRKRNRHCKVFTPSKADQVKIEMMKDEQQDYIP